MLWYKNNFLYKYIIFIPSKVNQLYASYTTTDGDSR